jgi:hypothetical protein
VPEHLALLELRRRERDDALIAREMGVLHSSNLPWAQDVLKGNKLFASKGALPYLAPLASLYRRPDFSDRKLTVSKSSHRNVTIYPKHVMCNGWLP